MFMNPNPRGLYGPNTRGVLVALAYCDRGLCRRHGRSLPAIDRSCFHSCKNKELTMSYRTILSLAAAAALSAACISTTSSDAFARGGARVGAHHARVGVHHGGVARRGVYRGTYANRGIYRGAAVGIGAVAVGTAAARAYNYNSNYGYAPYYGDTGYAYQQPYAYQRPYGWNSPYRHWTQF